jgi:hypothetical protein
MEKDINVLMKIQSSLKSPKGNFNEFGKYKYRSCEDILEAVKPILKENNCAITLNDEIIQIGDRFYIRATAQLFLNNASIFQTQAFAREESQKKGMDASQITGSASSYARKYALNGLLLIDDTKDADTMNNSLPNEQNMPSRVSKNKSHSEVYIIPFGKFKGKKINECSVKDLKEYASFIEHTAQDERKELQGVVLDFVLRVEKLNYNANEKGVTK